MKKTSILFGALLGLVSVTANAQKTGQATVNVKLHPIQTIIVNTPTVDLDYTTEADYANGVSATQADHLTVYSTGAFAVTVKSETDKLTSTAAGAIDTPIDASDITVKASAGTTRPLNATQVTYEPAVALSTTAATLFSSEIGGVNKNVNVKYTAKGDANQYVNKYFDVQSPTIYTATVTYEIAAK